MTIESPDTLITMTQIAAYGNVTRQAVYTAIRKKKLKAAKKKGIWWITKADFDEYRAGKYLREDVKWNGERIHDLEQGHLSVAHVCKIISAMIKMKYPRQRLYYLIRRGDVRAARKGGTWVIMKADAIALYEAEFGANKDQMRFA